MLLTATGTPMRKWVPTVPLRSCVKYLRCTHPTALRAAFRKRAVVWGNSLAHPCFHDLKGLFSLEPAAKKPGFCAHPARCRTKVGYTYKDGYPRYRSCAPQPVESVTNLTSGAELKITELSMLCRLVASIHIAPHSRCAETCVSPRNSRPTPSVEKSYP